MRLKLLPSETKVDFFKLSKITFGASIFGMIAALLLFFLLGLNFGIDFRGGTTIRTDASIPIEVSTYRSALSKLNLGDVSITEVFDWLAVEGDQLAYDD